MAQYNFRLFLKPTIIGQAIIDRLSPEGADRQALARRWIELGYALEQAGFRLDGTTLFQGARPLSLEMPVAVPAQWLQAPAAGTAPNEERVSQALVPAHVSHPTSTSSVAAAPATAGANTAEIGDTPAGPVIPPTPVVVPVTPVPAVRTSPALIEMADSLRGLSA
jgi:hypothetical protein